jgi:glycosylphosphatidylinositol transamidase (GPIT) subunit GPI8
MDSTLEKLKKYFPAPPKNAITKIYHARCERLRLLMNHGIPEDIRWLIEAKVRLSGESSNSFILYMPGTGKSTFAKKRHAK